VAKKKPRGHDPRGSHPDDEAMLQRYCVQVDAIIRTDVT
jgi:hypothetical protein